MVPASYMKKQQLLDILGRKALENLEIDVALKAFELAENISMVLTIKTFINEKENNLLMANIAMILGQYDHA